MVLWRGNLFMLTLDGEIYEVASLGDFDPESVLRRAV